MIHLNETTLGNSVRPLRITLVGTFRVETASGMDLTPKSAKSAALLAMLAMTSDYRRSRRWIEAKLWSDRGPVQASGSLRQALSEIRKCLGQDAGILLADRAHVWLRPEAVQVDIRHDPGAAARALTEGRDLLEGLSARDDEFEDWFRQERARWWPALARDKVDGGMRSAEVRRAAILKLQATLGEDDHARRVCRACAEMLRSLLGVDVQIEFTL